MEKCRVTSKTAHFINYLIFTLAFLVPLWARAFPARFAVGPDNNQAMLISAINSAQKELIVNIYQIDTPAIVEGIINKINLGLAVSLLVESSPVGGIGATEHVALDSIKRAIDSRNTGSQHLFMMGKQDRKGTRRFRFDHAKYLVIDSSSVYVTSENFTSTGHPDFGRVGNRGWDAFLNSPTLAQQLIEIFKSDLDPQHGDIYEYEDMHSIQPASRDASGNNRSITAYDSRTGDVERGTLVTSPNSLDGILNIIRSARQRIRVEEMSLPLNWRDPGITQDPIVSELIHAAERGVRVQVLLNDEQVFRHGSHRSEDAPLRGNDQTVDYLESYAKQNQLPLQARIVDVTATQITYIHNKGIIIDDQAVFVSSINGTQNSVMNNREVGILMESRDAAAYFAPVFDFDWAQSGGETSENSYAVSGLNWIGNFLFSLYPKIAF